MAETLKPYPHPTPPDPACKYAVQSLTVNGQTKSAQWQDYTLASGAPALVWRINQLGVPSSTSYGPGATVVTITFTLSAPGGSAPGSCTTMEALCPGAGGCVYAVFGPRYTMDCCPTGFAPLSQFSTLVRKRKHTGG